MCHILVYLLRELILCSKVYLNWIINYLFICIHATQSSIPDDLFAVQSLGLIGFNSWHILIDLALRGLRWSYLLPLEYLAMFRCGDPIDSTCLPTASECTLRMRSQL